MKKIVVFVVAVALAWSAYAQRSIRIQHRGGEHTTIDVTDPTRYLLLPVEEEADEAGVRVQPAQSLRGGLEDRYMDVRLAVRQVDYYIPIRIDVSGEKTAHIDVKGLSDKAVAWHLMMLSDDLDTTNKDYFRPVYHHTPAYGWMNDANGLTYKDGEYHLYFQHNPYGAKWGNMHWGHSVSKDLVHWEHLDPVLPRDTLGHTFSGSTVVDVDNTAGYGRGAIIAYYTSASDEHGQIQCMAYSTDNGRTFTKYEGNPTLVPADGRGDFRDPKVFWYAPLNMWYMIVSADYEMQFYRSKDLKRWTYVSSWGKGYGAPNNQFECPDFFQLPVEGDRNRQKWVMIVNINPGGLFGGSATQYFVGDFDGKEFKCDTRPEVARWMDYGKDHYATVTFSGLDRVVAVPWMSNWQYGNILPTYQFRSANALPRELFAFRQGGEVYVGARPAPEVACLDKEVRYLSDLASDISVPGLFGKETDAYKLEFTLVPTKGQLSGVRLMNREGGHADILLDTDKVEVPTEWKHLLAGTDLSKGRVIFDRSSIGCAPLRGAITHHDRETDEHRKALPYNYKDDYLLGTWAPLSLCKGGEYRVTVYVDKASVEVFVDGGRIAMTNTVFPTAPLNLLQLVPKTIVKDVTITLLEL